MIKRPDLFDTFLSASPALFWNNGYILNQTGPLINPTVKNPKPAFQISYGKLEQYPKQRRTETDAQFQERASFLAFSQMSTLSNQLFQNLKGARKLRDVSKHEYPFSDHAAVGAAALADGIDYFLDW